MEDKPESDTRIWTKIVLAVRLPFLTLQRATIPLTSQEHFSNFWLVTSIALSPFMVLIYFNLSDWLSCFLATLFGMALAAAVYFATKGSDCSVLCRR